MAKIKAACVALAEAITGDTVTAGSIAEAINKAAEGYATSKQAEAVDDSTASTIAGLVTDFNGLLDKLRDAGIIADD